jgi:hypothetical protein
MSGTPNPFGRASGDATGDALNDFCTLTFLGEMGCVLTHFRKILFSEFLIWQETKKTVGKHSTLCKDQKKNYVRYGREAPTIVSFLEKVRTQICICMELNLEVSYASLLKRSSKLGKYVENNRQPHTLGKKKVKYTRQTRCRTKQPREGARAFPSVTLGPFFLFLFFSIFIV